MNYLESVALTLWWAEGSKSRRDKRWARAVSYPVEITNTSVMVHKIFLKYLRDILHIPESRIKFQLQIHEGDNQIELEKYWSQELKLSLNQFQKTIIRPTGNKIGKSQGTGKVRFADKNTYLMLQSKLEELLTLI